jgi:hypothetical protein
MSRIVIVARTRMHGGHVCIGGHDLDRAFRGVRLLDELGDHFTDDSPFMVGDLWNIRYREKVSARPPHLEDVFALEYHPLGKVPDLKRLVLKAARPWAGGLDALFDGTVRTTPSGAAYIPTHGRLPRCSTGYWLPEQDLERQMFGNRARFLPSGQNPITRIAWVGVAGPPERIEAGSLVRVSLSRLFKADTAPEGYYVQISGVL